MNLPARKQYKKYTYDDYLTWPEDERWEIIDGIAYDMSPAPSTSHQRILRELLIQFGNYLTGKTCEVFAAPFDIRLPEADEQDKDIVNVVQPDIVVVCDKSKLDEKGCKGAPALIIEIKSPFTARKDIKEKFRLYERVGVKEYWIVDPTDKTVMVFKLGENKEYGKPDMYGDEDPINVGVFEDLTIDLKAVFQE